MNLKSNILYLVAAFCFLGTVSCDSELSAGGGVGGTGRTTSSGEVTAIGSVWVNGVRFDTRVAEIYVDDVYQGSGDQAVVDHLDVGRIVRVEGVVDTEGNGVAAKVSYTPLLTGPIDSIEAGDSHGTILSILGQGVILTGDTAWKGALPGSLVPGNLVEVSGFIDENGMILAVLVIKLADTVTPGTEFGVTGQISALDQINQHLSINSLRVLFDQADLSDIGPEGLTNGMIVYVNGQSQGGETDMSAHAIRRHRRLGDTDSGRIEIEGIVLQNTEDGPYTLEGYVFETHPGTIYVGGTALDLLSGVRIKLEGELAQGVVTADKITLSHQFRAESDLFGLNRAAGTLQLAGLNAITIATDDLTRFSGLEDEFEDLDIGDHLVIKGWLVDDQTALARQVITLPEVQDKVALLGSILDINEPVISVNGTLIDTDAIPEDGFYLDEETPVSRVLFFATIQPNDWVQARGELLPAQNVNWTSMALMSE